MPDDSASDAAGAPKPGSSGDITMKKTAYYGLVITAIVGIAVGAFFAGYMAASNASAPDYVTRSQLQDILSKAQPAAAPAAPLTEPSAAPKLIVSTDDDPLIGDPDAPVTIVEFSDFECPFCQRFYLQTLPLIMEHYVEPGLVNIVYRDFPIDRIHPNARITHIASECADEQGMFWQYHDILFEKQSEWNKLGAGDIVDRVIEYAGALSLDTSAFASCLNDPAINAEIDADLEHGRQYGTTGTPAFFIGNDESGYDLVSGAKPFEAFVDAIDGKLLG